MHRKQIFFLGCLAFIATGLIAILAALVIGINSQLFIPKPVLEEPGYTQSPFGYYEAPPDSTATPTPYQPLPPAPVFDFASVLKLPKAELVVPPQVAQETLLPPTITPMITLPVIDLTGPTPTDQSLENAPTEQINVLFLGADARPGQSNFRTDTILLVTLNPSMNRVNITSFPRDLYINIPGQGMDRINTAWFYGDWKLLKKTFKANFGVTVDNYVIVNFSSFKKIVDSLGGLEVQAAQPLSDYRYGYWVTVPAGEVHMDADTALWYARSRKTTNDISRNRRQQEVLKALFNKFMSLNALERAPEFYGIYKENVDTDLGLTDMLFWLPALVRAAQAQDFHFYAITYKQVYDYITPGGAMVLVPNMDEVMKIIQKSQNIP
jgi:LCP family protein required for cell wall assembly